MTAALAALWLCACEPPGEARYDGYTVVRFALDPDAPDAPEAAARLAALGSPWSEHVTDTLDVMLPPGARPDWPHEVLIPDVQARIDASVALPSAAGGPFDDWQPLDAIEDHLRELADGAEHAALLDIGTSIEGRSILALRLSAGPPGDKLGILIVGAQHAREWVSASSALWIADRLATTYGVDPDVTDLLDQYRVIVVPVANPDGYRYTWTTDRLWRKNRRDNGDGSFGVDPNRNWDAAWAGPASSDRPLSDDYRGAAPFSEPETAALAELMQAHPEIGLHLDLHCTGQLSLHPFGFTAAPSPDEPALAAASADAAAAMALPYGSTYRSGSFHTALYPASGVAIDWSHGVLGANAHLFELRDRGQYGFLLPADQLVPTAIEAWEGLLALAASPQRPHPSLALLDPLIPGQIVRAELRRLVAGADVELYVSVDGPGTTVLPDSVALSLAGAERIATGTAGARGRLQIGAPLPDEVQPGQTVWYQARSGPAISLVASGVAQ